MGDRQCLEKYTFGTFVGKLTTILRGWVISANNIKGIESWLISKMRCVNLSLVMSLVAASPQQLSFSLPCFG
jgi:hypothetical protein